MTLAQKLAAARTQALLHSFFGHDGFVKQNVILFKDLIQL